MITLDDPRLFVSVRCDHSDDNGNCKRKTTGRLVLCGNGTFRVDINSEKGADWQFARDSRNPEFPWSVRCPDHKQGSLAIVSH